MKKILIVDDQAVVRSLYSNKLGMDGYRVEVASDGEEGLEKIFNVRPDLVLLDLMLPRLGGAEVLRKVRARPEFQNLPVIIFSNVAGGEAVSEAWASGATQVLTKSNTPPNKVSQVVKSLLSEKPAQAVAQTAAAQVAQTVAQVAPSGVVAVPQTFDSPALTLPASAPQGEEDFQAGLRRTFHETLPSVVRSLSHAAQTLVANPRDLASLEELHRLTHSLAGNAGICEIWRVEHIASQMEALLAKLKARPSLVTASVLRTLCQGIGVLMATVSKAGYDGERDSRHFTVLVVDDEEIARRAAVYSLQTAGFDVMAAADSDSALGLLAANHFDMALLDVGMPGMSGYELRSKYRSNPLHRGLPIVFMTSEVEFRRQLDAGIDRAGDLIAKPFLKEELILKSLAYIMRRRLASPPHVKSAA